MTFMPKVEVAVNSDSHFRRRLTLKVICRPPHGSWTPLGAELAWGRGSPGGTLLGSESEESPGPRGPTRGNGRGSLRPEMLLKKLLSVDGKHMESGNISVTTVTPTGQGHLREPGGSQLPLLKVNEQRRGPREHLPVLWSCARQGPFLWGR